MWTTTFFFSIGSIANTTKKQKKTPSVRCFLFINLSILFVDLIDILKKKKERADLSLRVKTNKNDSFVGTLLLGRKAIHNKHMFPIKNEEYFYIKFPIKFNRITLAAGLNTKNKINKTNYRV